MLDTLETIAKKYDIDNPIHVFVSSLLNEEKSLNPIVLSAFILECRREWATFSSKRWQSLYIHIHSRIRISEKAKVFLLVRNFHQRGFFDNIVLFIALYYNATEAVRFLLSEGYSLTNLFLDPLLNERKNRILFLRGLTPEMVKLVEEYEPLDYETICPSMESCFFAVFCMTRRGHPYKVDDNIEYLYKRFPPELQERLKIAIDKVRLEKY